MHKFQIGDRVIVRRAPRKLYLDEDYYDFFPRFLEGESRLITGVESGELGGYHVEGSYILIFDFEVHLEKRVDLTQEAEWE